MILTKNSTTEMERGKPQRQDQIMIDRTAIHFLVKQKIAFYPPRNALGSRTGP